MRIHASVLGIALLGLAACSSEGSLDYTPTTALVPASQASVAAVTATDARDEKPNRLATVRGGYGNPFYVRDLSRPVAVEVADVFTKALRARGLLAASAEAPYTIQLVLRTLYGNKYLDRNAYIDIDLIVVDRAGRQIYKDSVKDHRDQFGGLFDGSIDDLQKLVQDLLNATVDRMLDNPNFRSVLAGGAVAAPSS